MNMARQVCQIRLCMELQTEHAHYNTVSWPINYSMHKSYLLAPWHTFEHDCATVHMSTPYMYSLQCVWSRHFLKHPYANIVRMLEPITGKV